MKISGEFIKYCLVGVVNTLVGISTAYILLNPLRQSYTISTIGAYITGIIVSYILNKTFTFKFKGGNDFVLFAKFAFSMLPCYVISYYLISPFLTKLALKVDFIYSIANWFFTLFGVSQDKIFDNSAIVMSMGVYLILGFSLNKYFIFRKNKQTDNNNN